ncbi:GMC family oxidoreductase N-terminal domain-containing protein [Halegenticoccus tardaugens]|uniref:GMC family oxidoreductase N-terminal domain-containing protein n=1 Tax=Halegenticoccus tardaugens TaxID=2071624 RepID=UPI001E39E18F|nr:GMC family oxidoreductase N-terminal domain-containing protein [Halegenticoccus tardaugens]
MAESKHDVVVVGAGGDGPALAWKLGEYGLDVLVLEAGPWHGNEKWERPHEEPGATASSDPDDLNGSLMDEQLNRREQETNDPVAGKLRVGPADRDRAPWFRNQPQNMFIWQVAAVGGTTIHYFGNHPRSYPLALDEQGHWPIDYADLVPYYQLIEEEAPVLPAPTTDKEALFYHGAEEAGYGLLDQKNVTDEGYRPQPNAIAHPDEKLRVENNYEGDFTYPDVEGSTLSGYHFQGGSLPLEAPVREKARKSSNVSWVPRALDTGNVTIRPNTYVTNVETEGILGTPTATGVEYRDTWTGETGTIDAEVVVAAGGCIETPRLWLNSDLPENEWVGKGLTTHWFDWVVGVFDEDAIRDAVGTDTVPPYVGQNSAARFDKPGVGGLESIGMSPALSSFAHYAFSQAG